MLRITRKTLNVQKLIPRKTIIVLSCNKITNFKINNLQKIKLQLQLTL